MISTAYLRVYQPIEAFPQEEQEGWLATSAQGERVDLPQTWTWLIRGELPGSTMDSASEGAFVRRIERKIFVCPWRTRLRMLVGLLAFRGTMPEEVADAFVPDKQARRAAAELARLGGAESSMRSHILHANWHVPLRWFVAFDASERVLVEDKDGLRIRYETTIAKARLRLTQAIGILQGSWIDERVTKTVTELSIWLDDFHEEALLELDYASVARLFSDDDLLDDQSSAEVWACLDALGTGDPARAGRVFSELTDRWAEVRGREVIN
jgi:hypothetical protein